MWDLYTFSFFVLTGANAGLGYIQYRNSQLVTKTKSEPPKYEEVEKQASISVSVDEVAGKGTTTTTTSQDMAMDFQKRFFGVYVLVVAADWLQGPYMYSLYKDEKGLPERTVAILFASGFVSAAISASFVGEYADRHGRKAACLVFCIAYAISCMTMLADWLPVLILGRMLGGLSTTLLFSVFETWMVHEFHARDMGNKGLVLSKIFGLMTTISSIVAIVAGIFGEALVDMSGTKVAPFMASMMCLVGAFGLINTTWSENFGNRNAPSTNAGVGAGTDIETILKDQRIVSLGLICCLFEGTMYLFVFFWSAALRSARAYTLNMSPAETHPPFGLVFATFMSAMMLGSQMFTTFSTQQQGSSSSSSQSLTVATSAQNLSFNLLMAAVSLLTITAFKREDITLWAFCAFEMTVGLYFPSMGFLKGAIVHDGVRGKVYGLMRLPLNLFVVLSLAFTQEGDKHRGNIFLTCSGLLIVTYVVCQRYLAQ